MRKDFGPLVIEGERRGSSAKNLKMRKTGRFRLESPDWEEWGYDGPLRICTRGLRGVKRRYDRKLREKSFTDVLAPVRGYLCKSIGRRWNDVFSELTAALDRGTYPIRHVLTVHMLSEVSIDTYCENGKIYSQPKRYDFGDYFVDPRDGTLRKEAARPRHRYVPPALDRHYWKDGIWFVRIDGIWYLGSYTKNGALVTQEERDDGWPNVQARGVIWHFVKWPQAGKKELKRALPSHRF